MSTETLPSTGALKAAENIARAAGCNRPMIVQGFAEIIDDCTQLPALLEALEKTTIFMETVVRNVTQMRDESSPQRTFCEAHIQMNRELLASQKEGQKP